MRRLIGVIALLALLAPPAYAQRSPSASEPSEKQKAAEAEKRKRAQEIDQAYKAAIQRVPDQQKADPWGSLRAPGGK